MPPSECWPPAGSLAGWDVTGRRDRPDIPL